MTARPRSPVPSEAETRDRTTALRRRSVGDDGDEAEVLVAPTVAAVAMAVAVAVAGANELVNAATEPWSRPRRMRA